MDLESIRQKSTEAEAFQRLHGMSLYDACELVCLPPKLYRGADVPLDWLPSPVEIEVMLRPLRRGKEKLKRIERETLTPPLLRGEKA
ncbi:hypothetical protein Enr13x_21210 [Stieleria neptunia]|uniref:Uncharacterized protein n=1 Tax=Stieleria neptunia TaxID=2527979 RepID=A0A518HN50_9BACT|nr:hypothetical protein [Stieleria neptunia]QDV42276.1 hypothetical protein Enr13x_21210 [Stieleria neptunia]